ncbi:SDR family NAD(P)-dependent oxidoreductase [Kineosporia succinea]|uniref:NAD(P)-dependent dehydrogenase (Short-subunit alcohol dehydrogenase family) n=1 Tax=Kineosporia succinea TaxID=84632 RepID=A0ABT9PCK1_9ACTN|nr:SDR family NAD(P)-dependent oxidoreductase [Kineosporia succinea]MDP9829700.1 NAD(P)-dependent dehydrogenase (short-subunit alcohol dehydrogenase family) [Kineosporia succinea]
MAPLITTSFSATSTATDVARGHDLTGVSAIVTGASSGLGAETARVLAGAGAAVTLAVRDVAAGQAAATDCLNATVRFLDLSDPASIARFVAAWDQPLHLLINNAGVVTGGPRRTSRGWELQLATNHLGHFALATGLLPALRRGAHERGGARVVTLSSTAHMRSGVDFDDLQFDRRPYDPQLAYARSKTANSLFGVEATRLWRDDGIVANTVNPGGVATGLQRHFTPRQKASLDAAEAAGVFTYKTVGQGAATTLVAALLPEFARTGGHYLDDCREAYTVPDDADLAQHPHGVMQWALDPDLATRLWAVSSDLTG